MRKCEELDELRLRGVRLIAATGLFAIVGISVLGWTLGSPQLPIATGIAILTSIPPLILARLGRHDLFARLTVGMAAVIYPLLSIFLFSNNPWQTDDHMYLFASLAMLILLYDWRPLVFSSAFLAAFLLIDQYLEPTLMFPGESDFKLVFFHIGALATQLGVLAYITFHLCSLIVAQSDAAQKRQRMVEESDRRSEELQAALDARHQAERREAEERVRREDAERVSADKRRAELIDLGHNFEESVSEIVTIVGRAAEELETSALSLNELARRASEETSRSAVTAGQSSAAASELARRIEHLTASIAEIAASVDEQARLGGDARTASNGGRVSVQALADRTDSITRFVDSIDQISRRTNLLALNATIEAARAGDVGRGFAVVAGEVKQLAGQSSNATGEIRNLTVSAQDGATTAFAALDTIADMVETLAATAERINAAVADQRSTASALRDNAKDSADGASMIEEQLSAVAGMAADTEKLSSGVSQAASGLSRTATQLGAATRRFIDRLQAA